MQFVVTLILLSFSMPRLTSVPKPSTRAQPYNKGRRATSTNKSKGGTSKEQKAMSSSWHTEQESGTASPIFFWKPHQPWGLFSQWYMVPFTDPLTGMTFNCNEQYMMYHKALTFSDTTTAEKILASDSPRRHKVLGRQVKGFTDEKWHEVSYQIVLNANLLKFRQGVALEADAFVYPLESRTLDQNRVTLRELLMSTGDRELVEASTFDRVWGIGYSQGKAGSAPREKWGKNLLGKALMEVRKTLREEDEDSVGTQGSLDD